MILLMAANAAAQESYVIDSVCQGAERIYRIEGEKSSDWIWKVHDADSTEVDIIANETGTGFSGINTDGDSIWGSEVEITWAVDTGTYYLSVEQTSNYISVVDGETYIHCVNHELGEVIVLPGPDAFAGDDIIACASDNVWLEGATASNYSEVIWTTFGDGGFSNPTVRRPTYFPGENDLATDSVTLSFTVIGQGWPGSCEPDVSTVTIFFSNPEVSFDVAPALCYGGNEGSVTATVTNGIEPYTFAWTGPDDFNRFGCRLVLPHSV